MLSRFRITAILVLVCFSARAEIKPGLKPYKVAGDLSNITNLTEFAEAVNHYGKPRFDLSAAQQELLSRNAFVVTPGDAEQFFQIYESEHFGMRPRVPNFLSADVVLHLYHLIFDFSLKGIEIDALYPALQELTEGMLEGSLKQYETITDSTLHAAAMKNICYFAVPARLMGMDPGIPQECFDIVDSEIAKIEQHQSSDISVITGFGIDYTQFIVRGHYTHSPETETYFKMMMWYQQASLILDPLELKAEPCPLLQATLMADILYLDEEGGVKLGNIADKINSIIYLYAGESNNLDPRGFLEVVPKLGTAYQQLSILLKGSNDSGMRFSKKSVVPEFVYQTLRPLSALPPAKISRGEPPKFAFFSQKALIDSEIMQALTEYPERKWPKGLDVMAVLGSDRAADILTPAFAPVRVGGADGPACSFLRVDL